jgi:hypothetical protein
MSHAQSPPAATSSTNTSFRCVLDPPPPPHIPLLTSVLLRDDYLECLHHRKELNRVRDMPLATYPA